VSLDSLEELARVAMTVNTAIQENVASVCFYIIENESQVGDDET
jgi:hypothetical protein